MTFKQYNSVKPNLHEHKYRRTGNECPVDECEGELLQADHERFCSECHTVMDEATFPNNNRSLYERWHEHRNKEYSGFYGEDRVKMIGGFEAPWIYNDESFEDQLSVSR